MGGALPYLAITMGLMSSFHCIGMCGPIALALPVKKGSRLLQFSALVFYNTGRAFTYGILGATIGLVGSSIAWIGYFRFISIFAGILMLFYVLWPSWLDTYLHPPKIWQKLIQSVRKKMASALQSRKLYSWLILGVLNGLLPCGMVYLALVSSIATGSVTDGGIFMLIFGIGTFPVMMAVGFFKSLFTPPLRSRIRKLTPFVIAAAGIWLVARGIFIQYPSKPDQTSTKITICHGK